MAEDGVKLWGKFGMRGRGALPFAPFSTKWSQCIQDAFEAKVECARCFLEKCLFNHHGWWTLLESDWRRNGVCNVLICLVTPRKSRGNKLTQGWENSYVPCHTTVPLFLSSPCSFLVLFAYLHLWYFCLAFDCFWSPLFIELKNRLWLLIVCQSSTWNCHLTSFQLSHPVLLC